MPSGPIHPDDRTRRPDQLVRAAAAPARRPKKGAVAERRAADVALAVQVARGASRGEQSGDRVAVDVEHRAVERGVQTAEGEHGRAGAAAITGLRRRPHPRPHVDRGERRREGPHPARSLPELGIGADRGEVVVPADGVSQRGRWHAHQLGEFFGSLRHVGRAHAPPLLFRHLLERWFVQHDPGAHVLPEQRRLADPAGIGVLVDEALPLAVHHDAARGETGNERDADLAGGHVPHRRAERLRHPDAASVVGARADLGVPQQPRRVRGEHGVVVDETAGGQHDAAARPEGQLRAVSARHHADDRAVGRDDQARRPGVEKRCGTGRPSGLGQAIHEQLATEVGGGRAMSARRGRGEAGERHAVLPQPHEPVVRRRHPGRSVPQRGLERHAAVGQPVEVRDAVLAVAGDLVRVGAGTEGGGQERSHGRGVVVEAAGPLDRCAAAEIDLAARQSGCATRTAHPIQHQHLRSGHRRLECRRRSSASVTDHQHIGLEVVGAHFGVRPRRDRIPLTHGIDLPAPAGGTGRRSW